MKDGVYFVGILSGVGIGLLTFLFGRSFKEAQETARSAVSRQVEERMAAIADNRIDLVRRSLLFVVFATGYFAYLNEVGQDYLVTVTNNSVSLVGTVVDAAYLAAGDL
jgi:hypothetical protein